MFLKLAYLQKLATGKPCAAVYYVVLNRVFTAYTKCMHPEAVYMCVYHADNFVHVNKTINSV